MKTLLTTLCIGLLAIGSVAKADTYEGAMTGIACSGCKKKIVKALGSLDGVVEVRIAQKEVEGQHKLTVKTDGSIQITEEQAKNTIAVANHYKMTSWRKLDKAE
ncbi:MAG: heavy-metal-associated domain-containing protein [Verrucomicrobiales bacterium]|nr:heavy-metal-associated domain-containing protein [Verrucomicrobiales bacterium]